MRYLNVPRKRLIVCCGKLIPPPSCFLHRNRGMRAPLAADSRNYTAAGGTSSTFPMRSAGTPYHLWGKGGGGQSEDIPSQSSSSATESIHQHQQERSDVLLARVGPSSHHDMRKKWPPLCVASTASGPTNCIQSRRRR